MMSGIFAQFLDLLPALWWPFCRFSAALLTAPFSGDAVTPVRARLAVALALAVVCLPTMQRLPAIDPFSLNGVAVAIEQALIGFVFGMAFQLVMAVLSILGFLVSSQMGLSMAVMNDPGNSTSSDVISNFLYLLSAMLFFAINGHLVLIQVVYSSFTAWPIGSGIDTLSLQTLAHSTSWVMSAAILLALPAAFATFVVQIGFGLINRVAPALNLFSLGFPLVTLFGLGTLTLIMRFVPEHYLQLTSQVLRVINTMMAAKHG